MVMGKRVLGVTPFDRPIGKTLKEKRMGTIPTPKSRENPPVARIELLETLGRGDSALGPGKEWDDWPC